MTGVLLLGTGLLLAFSALLSAMESAVFGVGASRLRTLIAEGFTGADGLDRVRARARQVRATVF
ncbi:MAG: hypothetical protein WD804_00660, partial [Gemmatimonadota bacterium]